MSDIFGILGMDSLAKDNLFDELDRDYYKTYPELWDKEEEFFLSHEGYTAIVEGKTDRYKRLRKPREQVTSQYIKRDNYHLWKVGRVYIVKHHSGKIRQVSLSSQDVRVSGNVSECHQVGINRDNIIGKLQLVDIKVGKRRMFGKLPNDELVFERIN